MSRKAEQAQARSGKAAAARTGSSAVDASKREGSGDTVEYLAGVLPELRALAAGADQAFIAYLLDMANLEAQQQLCEAARDAAPADTARSSARKHRA